METEQLTSSNKHTINVFKNDFIGKKIKKKGLYEKETLNYLRKLFANKSGLIIFDIGANIGNHSLDFSTYAEQVYSFEPVNFIFDVLTQNITENSINNITSVNRALSNEVGESDIYIVPHNLGASGFYEKVKNAKKVNVIKIVGDDYCAEQQITRIDFIKVDVEGHEEEVLRGLMKSIRRFKPIIMMEWNDINAIERINSNRFMDELSEIYTISVLGNIRDEGYWLGKKMNRLRRRLAKIFLPYWPRTYSFDENNVYNNVLLTPKNNE